jgi:hypothetical protein
MEIKCDNSEEVDEVVDVAQKANVPYRVRGILHKSVEIPDQYKGSIAPEINRRIQNKRTGIDPNKPQGEGASQ